MEYEKGALVSVILPAYNEAGTIANVVKGILEVLPDCELIVVDDGSTDSTAEQAKNAGAIALVNPYNLGNGASVKRGAQHSSRDVVVFMDADGQHSPSDIPALISKIGDYDMVIGARTKTSDTSRYRNIGNFCLIFIAQWISGFKIADLTSGFRAIKREVLLEFIHLFPAKYSYPTTITLAMLMSGCFVGWVPMVHVTRRVHGASGISPIQDFFRFVAIMVRMIVLFNPRRFFLPLSGIFFTVGVMVSIYQLVLSGGIQSTGVILILSSVYFSCFGLLADQVAMIRRERLGYKYTRDKK